MHPTKEIQVTDVAKVQITASQQEWIDHPVTQMAIKAIKNRQQGYDNRLVERCRLKTDEKMDIEDRACITTCQAILKILADPELFVKYSTMNPPNNK